MWISARTPPTGWCSRLSHLSARLWRVAGAPEPWLWAGLWEELRVHTFLIMGSAPWGEALLPHFGEVLFL